jgi:hypothetical protein
MKALQSLILVLVLVLNFIFVTPALADRPKPQKNPDYIEVTKAIDELTKTQVQTEGSIPEETAKQLADLEFFKYTLESGVNWGQCTNKTGKILAVYGLDPDEDDEDKPSNYASDLYFLADGQTTESEWDCQGFYIPNDVTATTVDNQGNPQELSGPTAVKILGGTQLIVTANPETGKLEFKSPLAKVVEGKAVNWFVPNISQALIDTRVVNAPTDS